MDTRSPTRVLRAAGGELLDEHGPEHQRRLRLHLDAHQHAARRAADPHRGGLRQVATDLPQRGYAEYRAGRRRRPSSRARSRWCKEVLQALRIPFVESEGYEADDLIATLTTQAEAAGMDVLICTGTDAFQLVSDEVTLYPVRGVSEVWTRMTPDKVEEKYGVRPERYSDSPRSSASPATTCPASPVSGPRLPRSDRGSTATSPARSRTSTRSRARRGSAARAPRRRCCATAPQPARPRRGARGRCRRPRPHRLGPRGGPPRLRRTGVPSAARPALRDLEPVEAESQGGFDPTPMC